MPRISDYEKWENEGVLQDKLTLVQGWARDGLTEPQIANNLGISLASLSNYKIKYVEFLDALKKGKEVVDLEVENALLKKAMGYNVKIKKVFKVKDVIYENGKRVRETERLETAEEEMHVPADTTAEIFWLKNRQKEKWRDKVEVANAGNGINNQIINIADLLNNPKPNRGEDDVQ